MRNLAKRRAKKLQADAAAPPIWEQAEAAAQSVEWGETYRDPARPEPVPLDPFEMFLFSLDADTRELLSDEELRSIYADQIAKAYAEKKAQKKKAAIERALETARMEAGLIPAEAQEAAAVMRRNAEPVRMTVELPPTGDQGEIADIGLRIDQKVFLHGHTYTLSRAQADSFREIIYRASQHELEFRGQNLRQRRWLLGRALGTVNSHIDFS